MENANRDRGPRTDKLNREIKSITEPQITYQPIPYSEVAGKIGPRPVWRVRFELASDTSQCFGLDINGEVVLGRGLSEPNTVDLSEYNARELGVSRHHLMLRPTSTNLYVLDLGSTNGTLHNGRELGRNSPYGLGNGDTLTLGGLQFVVRVIERPVGQTAVLREKADLADAMVQTAKAITSQLEVEEVLNQVAQTAMMLASAGETGIWLVHEKTSQLRLEAQHGIAEEEIRRMRISVDDSMAGEVIKTGKPLRASRGKDGKQIKIKTGYLVESVVYVPITLGGVNLGVVMAVHRESGKKFSERDERTLAAIADFAAIAIQNSRVYQATDEELAERVEELAALNELSRAVSSSLDLEVVHKVLVTQLLRRWDVEGVSLWLLDEYSGEMRPFSDEDERVFTGTSDQITKIIDRIIQTGEPEIADFIRAEKLSEDKEGKEGTVKMEAKMVAGVPLYLQNKVVGVLALYDKKGGSFNKRDLERLNAFATPVATAVENARLFFESERERATVHATAKTFPQPLLILDDDGKVIVSNQAAKELLDTYMGQVFEGLSTGVGRTSEIVIGDETYITTIEHSPEVGLIAVMQDITYVKRLEEARAEFVNAFSHDLKSPVSSIKGWAHLLEQFGDEEEKRTKFISQIGSTTDRVLGMIGQLLDIALLSDAPQDHHVVFDLSGAIEKALNDVQGAALAKSIKVEFEQDGKPRMFRGDPTRMYRSVLNLLDNAVKYSPENSQVKVNLTYGTDEVKIRVTDDGPGIPEEDLPRLFDKYYRGKQVHGPKSGVGLGLVVVQATARSHGGEVSVQNLEGRGAEFAISLPGTLLVT